MITNSKEEREGKSEVGMENGRKEREEQRMRMEKKVSKRRGLKTWEWQK